MRTRRGFTLLELLIVVAIMGLLGGIMVNGYRAVQRGMETRSVLQNVNQFIRSCYQRAQIDRQPVKVFFWNETLQEGGRDTVPIVVGKAVAVRRSGRLTRVDGEYLHDEFGDLRFNRYISDSDDETDDGDNSRSNSGGTVRLYQMDNVESKTPTFSTVYKTTAKQMISEVLLQGGSMNEGLESYAFRVSDPGDARWRVGSAYGFKFAEITLPHGYLFGSSWSKTTSNPISAATVMSFGVSMNSGSGSMSGTGANDTIDIRALRPGKDGEFEAKSIGSSASPSQSLSNTK